MSETSIWAIPALHDNYIWAAQRDSNVVVVDPGEAAPVLAELDNRGLTLCAILITHHHWDHVNGLDEILLAHDVPVYGPAVDTEVVPQIQHGLSQGDRISVPGIQLELDILEVPGHTLDHIAYTGEWGKERFVFCGDTLFSGGCGRLFEGDPPTMHQSLQKLAALPPDTRVYCTHEYTLANLNFACEVEPDNKQLQNYRDKVISLRNNNEISLPSSIGLELEINPFMRSHQDSIQRAAEQYAGQTIKDDIDTFAAIRRWKDNY